MTLSKPKYGLFFHHFGILFVSAIGLGAIGVIETTVYESGQKWTPVWEGNCGYSWNDQTDKVMFDCDGQTLEAPTKLAVDVYRIPDSQVFCTKVIGSFAQQEKWNCEVKETNI